MTRQFVTLMVGGALAVGWLSATLTQSADPAQSGRASSGPRPIGSGPTIVQQAERLRQHMAQPPQPNRGRNPFVYGPRESFRSSSSRGDRGVTPAAPPPQPIAPPPPPLPVFKLTGIASTAEGGTNVLTAILSDNGAMVFAKAGDRLSNGYSVVRVEENSVTLIDAEGVTQTIRLP